MGGGRRRRLPFTSNVNYRAADTSYKVAGRDLKELEQRKRRMCMARRRMTKADRDNRANQMNPNNWRYQGKNKKQGKKKVRVTVVYIYD